ncbi:MAG TPA: peptidoglycan editing factor PgeF [Candidatus Polarisedimenticolia bacterium]|nr:peptidoglycan editing factor PgeF [Candidatus Polarisedimenticolia bacterium]
MRSTIAKKKASPTRRRAASTLSPWKLRSVGGLRVLEAPPLARLGWLVHGFSTRPGGASEFAAGHGENARHGRNAGERVLNLGFTDWDSRERVLENRKKFFHAIGADRLRVVTLRQIHSDIVRRVDSPLSADQPPQGDALFTREPGVLLAVQTADCIPILLADTKQRAVAAIHAGWRGTVRRIAAKTLGRMQMEFGTRPEDVVAALGPGIARCCYEVGSDVVRDFHAQFSNARDWFDGPFDALASGENDPNWLPWLTMMPPGHPPPLPRVQLDLLAANRSILADAGVPQRRISSSGYCTSCRPDLFFSYRRERSTGRLMAAIGIV